MDSLTHIFLGAAVGEVLAGKKMGKRAMLVGAAANSLPDIDFVAGLWMSPSQYSIAHRGFTHSFLFAVIASLLLSWAVNNFSSLKISFRYWGVFFFVQILIHILLDSLNAYGIGWFEPFSHTRISYDLLFVADPFFTIWLLITCLVLLMLRTQSPARMKAAVTGIVISMAYIGYAINNKLIIHDAVSESFAQQQIVPVKTLITPTPLNCWLWYVVADVGDGCFIGYHSVFDRQPSLANQFFSKNDSLLDPIRSKEETEQLVRLARDLYTVERHHDTLVFNNLRFGQINGWENPRAGFIFSYNLGMRNSLLTIQKGRFSGWSKKTTSSFLKRIEGS